MADDEVPQEVIAQAKKVVKWSFWDKVVDYAKLALIFALLVGNAILYGALASSREVTQRIELGQTKDRCEARRVGEFLASFSDYLGVAPSDPYRKELDDHLKKVSNQIRSKGDVCAPVPPPPTTLPR